MKRVLIAVDSTKRSTALLTTFKNTVSQPDVVILLHVQRLEGRSLMIDMLSEAEFSTLKESLQGTEHKEALDQHSEKLLAFYQKALEAQGSYSVKKVTRAGNPAEEILDVAVQEGADLILLGSDGRKGINRLLSGSVTAQVYKKAMVPVLLSSRPLMCEEPYSWKDAYAAVTVTSIIFLGMFLLGIFL